MESKLSLQPETLQQLERLVNANVDASAGFYEAAEQVQHDAVGELFRHIARQGSAQAEELKAFLIANRDGHQHSSRKPTTGLWKNLSEAYTETDAVELLAEGEETERALEQRYIDVLKTIPGSAVSDVLHRHFANIRRAHEVLKRARDYWDE